ncbi:MAG: phosphate/sulfate permease [Candidatus Bathyarchaeota archaeon B26-1]|nr:MAG: phosphate/sulfate permease [Candidatus Bathyarchaeota archaeon B26-1]
MFFEALTLSLGILVCLVLGANNASACFGTSVGAGFTKHSEAAGLAVLGVLLGVTLEGTKLSRTISGGVLTEAFPSLEPILVMMVTIVVLMTAATFFNLPLSLSEGFVGSAIGVGLGVGITVNWSFSLRVFASWVLTPLFSALAAAFVYKVVERATRAVKRILTLNYIYGKATLILSFYVAYVLGANTVGLVSGLYQPILERQISAFVFGAATALGIYFLSWRITESVGSGIISLSPSTALVAQFSGAFTVHIFTQFGLPVSITQAIIGGILGIGLAKKIAILNVGAVNKTVAGWTLAPILGTAISYVLVMLI